MATEEVDVFAAREAMKDGQSAPIGSYLYDVAQILTRLADLFDPVEIGPQPKKQLRFSYGRHPEEQRSHADPDAEWESSRTQVEEAIEAKRTKPVGWYLRDASDFLTALSLRFNPPKNSRDWRLEFVRKGRGRRSDEKFRLFKDSSSASKINNNHRPSGKARECYCGNRGAGWIQQTHYFSQKEGSHFWQKINQI